MTEQGVKPGRIVVVETVYHQQAGADPVSTESRYAAELTTDEQPFSRVLKVGEEPVKLDAWLTDSRLIHIAVLKSHHQRKPDAEERAARAAMMLEVSCGDREGGRAADWLVAPGESMRARPASLDSIRLRSQSGILKVAVTVFPA